MNHDEIVERIIDLLRQHKDGFRGSIYQEPYRGDFFKMFASAFNEGFLEWSSGSNYLSADAMADTILARAPELVDSSTHYTTWSYLHTFWQEWTYAWKRADERRHH